MKLLVLSLILFPVVSTTAQPPGAIQRVLLNPLAVTRIPVAMDRLTTVRFPSPVSDLESALISTEVHPDALFLLSFQPGNSFFSLRALRGNTNTTLNVTWKSQTYVFEIIESRTPWLSVILDPPAEPASNSTPRPVPPSRLLGLLDTARAYGFLRQQQPAVVAGVEVARPNTRHDYGEYTIRIEEVFRFEREDTLVFRIAISNKTSAAMQFVPQSLMVRAGQRFFYQSITDATGSVPPAASVPVYFAITGSSDGSLNALSPKNDFMVLLNRLETTAPPDRTPRNQGGVPPGRIQRTAPQFDVPPAAPTSPPQGSGAAPRRAAVPVSPAPQRGRTSRPPPAIGAPPSWAPQIQSPPPPAPVDRTSVNSARTPVPPPRTPPPVANVPGPHRYQSSPPEVHCRKWGPFHFHRRSPFGFGIRFSFCPDD